MKVNGKRSNLPIGEFFLLVEKRGRIMTIKRKLLCGVAGAAMAVSLAVGGQAVAADLPDYVAPVAAAPVPTWEGFYIGAHAGWGRSEYKGQDSDNVTTLKANPQGFLVGLHAGYNWQRDAFVYGIEADIDGTPGWSGRQTTCADCSSGISGELGGLATVRGRLGWAFDRTLIFATGGIAFASSNAVGASTPPSYFSRDPQIEVGAVAGGGIEWKYNQDVSLRLDGQYYWFDEKRNTPGTSGFAGIQNAYSIRVGASWYLN